jgi:hypothetical protein
MLIGILGRGKIKKGDNLILSSFGAGYTGVPYVKWACVKSPARRLEQTSEVLKSGSFITKLN